MFTCTKQIFFSCILYFCLALLFDAIFLLRTVFEADKPNVTKWWAGKLRERFFRQCKVNRTNGGKGGKNKNDSSWEVFDTFYVCNSSTNNQENGRWVTDGVRADGYNDNPVVQIFQKQWQGVRFRWSTEGCKTWIKCLLSYKDFNIDIFLYSEGNRLLFPSPMTLIHMRHSGLRNKNTTQLTLWGRLHTLYMPITSITFHQNKCIYLFIYLFVNRGSSVSTVSVYGLDDRANEVPSPADAKNFSSSLCVQTGSGAHPASCTMGTRGPFPGAKRGLGVTLTTPPHLMPRSRMSRSYTSSPPSFSVECSGTALALFIYLFSEQSQSHAGLEQTRQVSAS
jgi:hypothetical protein